MSDEATGAASEGTPSGSSEGSGDGVPAGFVPQADLDQLETRRRSLQSEVDKERSARADLEKRLAALESGTGTPAPAAAPPALTAEAIAAQVEARIARYHAMEDAKKEAREKFPNAPADVLTSNFDSPEALLVAAGDAHKRVEAQRAEMRSQVEAELLASIKEKHGIDLTPQTTPTPTDDGTSGLTLDRLASMTQAEFEAVPDEVRKRLMAGAGV